MKEYLNKQENEIGHGQPGFYPHRFPAEQTCDIEDAYQQVHQRGEQPAQCNDDRIDIPGMDEIMRTLYHQAYHEKDITDKGKPRKKGYDSHNSLGDDAL